MLVFCDIMDFMNKVKRNKGFTLVELSIVIVIIGLIVAGVVGGQTLVKQAKLRSIVTDINSYKVAVNTFRLEYNALPGDFDNANAYWGASGVDGNGNKRVNSSEQVEFWRHLSLAGLVKGNYTGGGVSPGVSVPTGPLSSSIYRFTSHVVPMYGTTGNFFSFVSHPCGALNQCGVLVPKEAHAIDSKSDDGLADSGLIYATTRLGESASATTCTDGHWNAGGSQDLNAAYNLDVTDANCRIFFWHDKL